VHCHRNNFQQAILNHPQSKIILLRKLQLWPSLLRFIHAIVAVIVAVFVCAYEAKVSPLQKTLLLLCAMCLTTQAGINLFHELSGTRFGGDFICFWTTAHRVRHGDIAAIYDPDTWHRILSTTTGPISISWFVYPPFTLFGLWPLGNATYNEAVLAWSLLPLAFYFALIVWVARRSGLGLDANPACENRWSRAQAYAVLIAFSLPFLSANLIFGQTGTLVAVFFLGMAYFWPFRPILAGICIGFLAIKPQMGLLIPFALLASGQWMMHGYVSGWSASAAASSTNPPPSCWSAALRYARGYDFTWRTTAHPGHATKCPVASHVAHYRRFGWRLASAR
jgi:hypothetical protein